MMTKQTFQIALLLLVAGSLYAQRVAPDTYWFYFTDKNDNGYTVSEPEQFLTQRSIDRRGWQNLPVDQSDMPVTKKYTDSLTAMGLNVLFTSKWLNGALISSTDTSLVDTLYYLSFVDTIPWKPSVYDLYYPKPSSTKRFEDPYPTPPEYSYGISYDQNHQLKLDFMHSKGFSGNGVLLAVLDAGFLYMEGLPAFESAYANGKIRATKNFVNRNAGVYESHTHGMHVSSIIMANWPNNLIGTAPDVDLLLALTENVASETRIEEFSWIAGAEWADSLGADILNTSLGYTTFDDPSTNYSYEDLDGKTAHISVANSMTAAKGMVSVTSAGNSGSDPWYYIGTPADATDILAVGAADRTGMLANFSSRGPTYDHRIKPDVTAMGSKTAIQNWDSTATQGSGTSYSSPLIAGAAAVLWQAYPSLTAKELIRWIIESGDRYEFPDIEYGYGIPSFRAAYYAITSVENSALSGNLKIYPNPFADYINIDISEPAFEGFELTVFDIQGRTVFKKQQVMPGRTELPESLQPGLYIFEIKNEALQHRSRLIKY